MHSQEHVTFVLCMFYNHTCIHFSQESHGEGEDTYQS